MRIRLPIRLVVIAFIYCCFGLGIFCFKQICFQEFSSGSKLIHHQMTRFLIRKYMVMPVIDRMTKTPARTS